LLSDISDRNLLPTFDQNIVHGDSNTSDAPIVRFLR
jgi:hypothetical protein